MAIGCTELMVVWMVYPLQLGNRVVYHLDSPMELRFRQLDLLSVLRLVHIIPLRRT